VSCSARFRSSVAFYLTLAACGLVDAGEARGRIVERTRATLVRAQRSFDDGELDRAAELFREAREDATSLGTLSLPLARATDGLADVHRMQGRPARAVDLYLRSSALWSALLGPRQPRLATTLHNLAAAYEALGRPELAVPQLRRALEIWEATLGPDSAQAQATRRAYLRLTDASG